MGNRIMAAIAAASIITLGAAAGGMAVAQQDGAAAPHATAPEPASPAQAGTQDGAAPMPMMEPREAEGGWEHRHEMMRRMMMMRAMRGEHGWGMRGRLAAPGTFGLFPPNEDKQLAPADVQEIAQAILLWHGNHAWKVVEVHEAGTGKVAFAYATSDNSVIARFEVDRRTGRITRTG